MAEKLTHSRIKSAKTCLRRHYYRYELGIDREQDNANLRKGTAVHLGIALQAQSEDEDVAILRATAGYHEKPTWCDTEELWHQWCIERETITRLLRAYFWRWQEDGLEPVAVELPFEVPVVNPDTGARTPNFTLAGKIDMIVRLPDGRLAVKETKTTSDDLSADSDYWRRLRLDFQISLYMLAARSLEHEVETVLYDAIRKPAIQPKQIPTLDPNGCKIVLDSDGQRVYNSNGKPRQSADKAKGWALQTRPETPEEFGERLTNDIVSRPDFYFARHEIPRLDADLEDAQHELWEIQQTLRACQRHGRWFRNEAACLGTRMGRCPYLDICHNGVLVDGQPPEGFVKLENIHPELEDDES